MLSAKCSMLLRPRMRLIVNLQHMLDGKLRVTLGGRKTFMPEHFLDRAQIGAFFQHVSSKRVT